MEDKVTQEISIPFKLFMEKGAQCYWVQKVSVYALCGKCINPCLCDFDRTNTSPFLEFLEASEAAIPGDFGDVQPWLHEFSFIALQGYCGMFYTHAVARVYCGQEIENNIYGKGWKRDHSFLRYICDQSMTFDSGVFAWEIVKGQYPTFWLDAPQAGEVNYDFFMNFQCCAGFNDFVESNGTIW